MSRHDWYSNKDWSPAIEAAFSAKLARAREKQQYLRIQASFLTRSHPRVSLALLEKYFELGEHFDIAQAHCDKAEAYLALGDVDSAVASYEAALNREETHPHLKTSAYLYLPLLIIRERLARRYEQALELLQKNRGRVIFPVDLFRWNAVFAVIMDASGNELKAIDGANAALKAAGMKHSGFSHHPTIGLVSPEDADLLHRIKKIARYV